MSATHLACTGCGAAPGDGDPFPFRCPNSGHGDVDHVIARILDPRAVSFPHEGELDPNPFVRYRSLLHSHARALSGGMTDARFVELVRTLDLQVARVDGTGFVETPLGRSAALSGALGIGSQGGVFLKDETGNVSGSHKGRHLMGILLHLEVAEQIGASDPHRRPDLAVASCGNAALAAAVLASAAGRHLRVLVPAGADPKVVQHLEQLSAEIVVCPRRAGEHGDPTYLRLLEELDRGAVPFTCQGNLNGLAIEGGETLGYEIASAVAAGLPAPDHLIVQVGGGALAASCSQALAEACALGALDRRPRIHTVQTSSAHPLERAYRKVLETLPASPSAADVDLALRTAAGRRSEYMWPWESEPKSIATGILDDETYDWLSVVRAMLETGGRPLVVSEEQLAEANELGRAAGYDVDPTGSAGLAGLLALLDDGGIQPSERVVLLFTGVQR